MYVNMNCTSMYTEKLELVFSKFLLPKCRINNDVYLEKFLTHLSSKYEKEPLNTAQFSCEIRFIENVISRLSKEDEAPTAAVVAFSLKLLAVLIGNEWQFASIKEKQIFEEIQSALENNPNLRTPSIKLANVKLLVSIAKHPSGLQWIKKTSTWKTVVRYCERNHTLYVVRESMTFIYDILQKYSNLSKDEELVEEIVREIFHNLLKYENKTNEISVDDVTAQQNLTPTLNLVSYILKRSVESNECNRTMLNFMESVNLEKVMWKFATMTHDHQFLGQILRIFVLNNFWRLHASDDNQISTMDLNRFGLNFFNYMNFCIGRRSSINIFKIAELNHTIWVKMGNRLPHEFLFEHQNIKFEDQFIILQVLPIIHFIQKDNPTCLVVEGNCLDQYILKLFNISSEHTTRLCYAFRDILNTTDNSDDLAYKSIQGILSMKCILHRDRAIIVLQALMFSLKGYAPDAIYGEITSSNTDILIRRPNLLSAVLSGLQALISHFKVTWKECLESTVLLNVLIALLNNPNLTTRLSVQVLKLTQLSIEYFMAPNLALLIDTLKGSTMEHLGPTIKKRLHDNEWETRDSTLELLHSIVEISSTKFPAFQQHIIDNDICPIIISMAKNDSEPYVRATALTCFAAMLEIKLFWDHCFGNLEILPDLLFVLCNESEGVVRKAAVKVVKILYITQKIPRLYLDSVFSSLAHCAVNDLYWEVKIEALHFWQNVFCRQCKHQGIIDGTFPMVTFSVEHKKIVTLTPKEITLRLKKLLGELALRGFLGVMIQCMDDECDLEVAKEAVHITDILIKFLNKYNYCEESKKILENAENISVIDINYSEFKNDVINNFPKTRNNADSADSTSTSNVAPLKLDSEKIIEMIVESDDVNLLVNAYENQMNVTNGDESKINEDYYKHFYTSPEEFLNKVTSIDLNEKIAQKSDWISQTESFDSLLDDILLSFKEVEANDADCY